MRAVRTLCARRVLAVNTLQQLLARCENVKDAVKTLWERRVDAVGTLLIFLGVFRSDPTVRCHGFRTLYKRCGIAVWCDRGFKGTRAHNFGLESTYIKL